MTVSRRQVVGALVSPLLSRSEAEVTPELFQFRPEMEPLVQLIERIPRERCAEVVVEQLRHGVSYRQMLAALFLAGVRNVNPRPPGFALHCVFVIHSAHLIGMEAPADSRLIPLFYALDNFKTAQERDAAQPGGDYVMRALRGALPAPDRAAGELASALDFWDGERGERAAAAMARHGLVSEAFAMLWQYGARDYRNIGHKAIYVANAQRALQALGWQHAEPVLRSLILSLTDFGAKQQMNGYAFDDQCYGGNLRLVKDSFAKLPSQWTSVEAAGTLEVLQAIRTAKPEEACAAISARLVKGTANAAGAWDAAHLAAAELRMSLVSNVIVGLHAVSSMNALHHAYLAAPDAQTRFLLLLQAAGWLGQFRTFAGTHENSLRTFSITEMEPAASDGPLEEVFANLPAKADAAAAQVLRLAANPASRRAYMAAALRSIAVKADEVHYYKYLAALVEDIALMTPRWQPHLVAATAYYAKGANDAEPPPMKRAREALKSLPA
jgi:hypothetical protein